LGILDMEADETFTPERKQKMDAPTQKFSSGKI
jgi:hypothetical protein